MQIFPPALRIAQSVTAIAAGAPGVDPDDSLAAINTNEMSPDAICAVKANNSLYMLHKESTATADGTNIVAPSQGGPGRWFKIGQGATYFQVVNVFHEAIPPASTVDASATVLGVAGGTDIIEFNVLDSAVPAGVIMGQPRVTGGSSAVFRFLNTTAATVAAATVAIEAAVFRL